MTPLQTAATAFLGIVYSVESKCLYQCISANIYQDNKSPPCSSLHRQFLWRSTDPAENSGAAGDTPLPFHLPVGWQTGDSGDSRWPSEERTHKHDALFKKRTYNITKDNKNLPLFGHDRPGRRHGTPSLQHHWGGRCNRRAWPPDQTVSEFHIGLVIKRNNHQEFNSIPLNENFCGAHFLTCTFKVETKHRA